MQLGNPYGWVLLAVTLALLSQTPVIWQRRRSPGAVIALVFLGGVIVWLGGYSLELFSTSAEMMLLYGRIQYLGIVTVPGTWLAFVLAYTGRSRVLGKRWWLLLLIEPALVVALVWTNDLHHLMVRQAQSVLVSGYYLLEITSRGPVFWMHVAYSYVIMLVATVLMAQVVLRAPGLYRHQVMLILLGVAAPWAANFLYLTGETTVDFTPVGFGVTALVLALSLTRFQLFDIVPIARDILIDTIKDGLVVVDRAGRVVDANRAAVMLLVTDTLPRPALNLWAPSAYGLVGRRVEEVFSRWREPLLNLLQGEEGVIEINLGRGSVPHWFEVRLAFIRSRVNRWIGQGAPSGKILIFHDIQMRKQAEELLTGMRDQAVQASMIKSQLIANVSHDLRTPLNAILGYGDMLLDGVFDPLKPNQAEVIQQILYSAHQVNLFISDLLDQGLLERGKLRLTITDFPPDELVQLIFALNGPAAANRGLSLRHEIGSGFPERIRGDLRRLQQILMNLVGNAVKFTDKGSVTVRLLLAGADCWAMEVEDTGIGIPAEAQSYIFEPYRQVEDMASSRGGAVNLRGGSGLGLSIVQHLVTHMGGHIELRSAPGEGSTFRVILPLNPLSHSDKETK